ncbi:MAG: kinase-like domain-containing protein [Linnemannia gamsii]|nr:MAG: kinase-like domain-containing protein [Linnemannia gamsii]
MKLYEGDNRRSGKREATNSTTVRQKGGGKNILKFYDFFTSEDQACVVLQYCPQTLTEHLRVNEHTLTPADRQGIALSVCEGIQFLHSIGLVHRDIKPDNILITNKGEIKIADLGAATTPDANGQMTGFHGTPGYAAPEVKDNKTPYDIMVDSVSLGSTIHHHGQAGPDEGEGHIDLRASKPDPDPSKRASIDEALAHVFFKESLGATTHVVQPSGSSFEGKGKEVPGRGRAQTAAAGSGVGGAGAGSGAGVGSGAGIGSGVGVGSGAGVQGSSNYTTAPTMLNPKPALFNSILARPPLTGNSSTEKDPSPDPPVVRH